MSLLFASGELKKMKIEAFAAPDYEQSGAAIGTAWEAFINPSEYSLTYAVDFDDTNAPGTTASPATFTRIRARNLSLIFYLDGTGANGVQLNVQEKITAFFQTAGFNGTTHRPNYLRISWGSFLFDCSLQTASIQYKMFTPDGGPLRAVITASFLENIHDAKRVEIEETSSPDLTHIRMVKDGDTLPLMTFKIYGDSKYYLEVARANNLSDFRNLKPGQKIFFPPFEKKTNRKN